MADPRPADPQGGPQSARPGWLLDAVRYVLPSIVVLGGLVVMALGGESRLEGGAGIVSAGLAIFFLNWLFRTGVTGERERDAEEAARDYFDRHGRWPD
ncbi:MAG TPA: hypothetical protein VFC30_04285 [Solirubrobacteraceae bacterium]|nr:hypothetical protein [Solirubrobacteraceae bacterium]